MRSTHACTPSFCNFFHPIFTSVVVYSRTKIKKKQIQTTELWQRSALYLFFRGNIQSLTNLITQFTNLHSRAIKKQRSEKKMRSTHACTPSFATFLTQYSRRLLSILAQQKINANKKTKKRFCVCEPFLLLFALKRLIS